MDTTTAPCQDFYQYATGGWYYRMSLVAPEQREYHKGLLAYSRSRWTLLGLFADGTPSFRPYEQLRQLVAQAPKLAQTTTDPTLRAVGYFYGSCLADTSGTAEGVAGDTARASYCFRTTRRHLDRALFELFMEHVWPPEGRAASSHLAANVMGAAAARARASKALSASRRQELATRMLNADFYLGGSADTAPHRRMLLKQLWQSAPHRPAGVRGPSGMVFTGPAVERTWVYRDYAGMGLSPTAFRDNVARLRAAPDTIPLPVLPDATPVLDALLGDQGENRPSEGSPDSMVWRLSLAQLVPPLVNGQLDIGAWYGGLRMEGHEIAEQAWLGPLTDQSLKTPEAELAAFAEEQFQGQMPFPHHTAFDLAGLLILSDAFQRARQDWPTAKIEGFTPEQRFFLGAAWAYRGGAVINSIKLAAGRWRVGINGAFSALPTFARAFGCQAGAPMAGGQKWYQAPWQNLVLSAAQRAALAQDYDSLLQTMLTKLKVKLTTEQEAAFAQRRQGHAAQRRALFGDPGQAGPVGTLVEMYHLLGQELGEARAVLPPEQQATFDKAAAGLRLDADERAYLVIPRVAP